jgi:hypothetical protein
MKQLILILSVFFTIVSNAFSQTAHKGKSKLQAQFDSLGHVNRAYYLAGKLDSLPAINSKMLQLAQKIKADSSLANAYGIISNYFFSKGDYAICIEYTLKSVDYVQKGYQKRLAIMYGNLAMTYVQLENYPLALYYLRKGQQFIPIDIEGIGASSVYSGLAVVFCKMLRPDSALKYAQLDYQENLKKHREYKYNKAYVYRNFGLVYEQLNEPELANYYYKKGVRYCDSMKYMRMLSQTAEFYSLYLMKHAKYKEARDYALSGFNASEKMGNKGEIVATSNILYTLYDQHGNADSAYYYLKLNHIYQDSLQAEQKTNQLQAVIANQQIKETEQNAKAAQDEEQRRRNIQYAAIALGLVLLLMIFLLLSRSVMVNTRTIEMVGVIGLLIVFEFINLVLHPYLAALTNDSPLLMLLILVLIAAVIVPLHHQLEQWIKHKLVEKNKTIRLAAAKRTIEKLEGGR